MIKEYVEKCRKNGIKDTIQPFIDKIKKNELNTFITFDEEYIDKQIEELKDKDDLPLYGLPVGIKDNIAVKGLKLTCGSKMLKDYVSPYDADVVKKLKENGAIIVGKQNMDEFAMGSSTETSHFGPVLNPYDKERVPGGSSGGSAASVANDEVIVSLGSDTGGSIRQPAAFCGVVGLSPQYGTVSRYGLVSFASSLDRIGPLTKEVKDTFIIYNIISGRSPSDMTSQRGVKIDIEKRNDTSLKIGYPKEFYEGELDEGIKTVMDKVWVYLTNKHKKIEGSLPLMPYSVSVYQAITMSEVSSNLSRYDGIKYGLQAKEANTMHDIYYSIRGEGFGEEVKRRVLSGTYILSSNEFGNVYEYALKVREKMREDILKMFEEVDLIVAPTSPSLPFKFGERTDDPLKMHFSDALTAYANLAGMHSINIPAGFSNNLPVGVQIIAPEGKEQLLYELSLQIEEGVKSGKI